LSDKVRYIYASLQKDYLFCRYPKEKKRRFRCGHSDICIDEKYLCDGVIDCQAVNNIDDEIVCPWRQTKAIDEEHRNFICQDNTVLHIKDRCNGYSDCIDEEDEHFCYLGEQEKNQASLFASHVDDIVLYPPFTTVYNRQKSSSVILSAAQSKQPIK